MGTILITGAARGLGKVTAAKLAKAGHRVLLVARTREQSAAAMRELLALAPGSQFEPRHADLSSLEDVRRLARELLDEGVALDVLLNVAGVMQTNPVRQLSAEGYEQTLAVNTLAPFLLTRMLLSALERAQAARVVNVTSRLHLPGSRGAPVNFDFADPNLERGYYPERAYKNSKLALLWFTYELQRRLKKRHVTVNAVCPGFVPATAAASSRKPFERWLLRHVLVHMPFATTVEAASDSLVFMAIDPSLEGTGGCFFGEKRTLASSPESYDLEKAKRFWDLASQLTGLPS